MSYENPSKRPSEKPSKFPKKNRTTVIVFVCIAALVIILTNLFFIFTVCCPELMGNIFSENTSQRIVLSDAERVESTLLSTGLTILGLVIAVWTGLNIINTIDKREVERLQSAITEQQKTAQELQEKIQELDNTEREISKKADEYETSKSKVDKSKFIHELYKTATDRMSQFFIDKFNRRKDSDDAMRQHLYLDLLRIEEQFRKVFELHEAKYAPNEDLEDEANRGIEIGKELLSRVEASSLYFHYIKFRMAEFFYYIGYCRTGNARMKLFLEAIKFYAESVQELEIDIPEYREYENYDDILFGAYEGEDTETIAYMCNTIGDSYSMIAQIKNALRGLASQDELEMYAKKAVFYCAYAAHLNAKSLYIKNLGVALERQNGFNLSIYPQLCKHYKEALEKDSGNTACFKTLLSAHDKYINHLLNIQPVKLPDRRKPSLNSPEFAEHWNKLNDDEKQNIFDILQKIHDISTKAKQLHANKEEGYLYDCIYYRNMIAILNCSESSEENRHKIQSLSDEAEYNWSLLNLVAPYDPINNTNPMTRIIRNDLDDFKM